VHLSLVQAHDPEVHDACPKMHNMFGALHAIPSFGFELVTVVLAGDSNSNLSVCVGLANWDCRFVDVAWVMGP
jgi:hypothetical protein